MDHCPQESTILKFVGRELDRPAAEAVASHLDACHECRRVVAELAKDLVADPAPEAKWAEEAEETLGAGATVGRFVIISVAGAGSMGVVYAAFDPALNRKIALKILRRPQGSSRVAERHERLAREARALARISHPHVVAVHDVGAIGDRRFIAMEFVEGMTLTRWLQAEPRHWRQVLAVLLQAGRGLSAAHAAGLVHRDFKPENVLVGAHDQVRITDFGLAAPTDDDGPNEATSDTSGNRPGTMPLANCGAEASLTATGAVIGTPAYMAPERHLRRPADARSDQFAFCATAFQALYGVLPFSTSSYRELVEHIVAGRLAPIPQGREVPKRVHAAVLRGLRAEPAERFPSMEALLATLENNPHLKWRRVTRFVAAAALVALAMAGAARLGKQPPPCQDEGGQLTGAWNADARRRIHSAFAATGRPYAESTALKVTGGFDQFANGWTLMREETCEATYVRHEQSDTLFDLRMQCLGRRKQELEAAVKLLSSRVDAETVDNALASLPQLTSLQACADAPALQAAVPLPDDKALRLNVFALRSQLAEAAQRERLGKYQDARADLGKLIDRARGIPYAPLLAESLFLRAKVESRLGDQAAAEATLDEVARLPTKDDDLLAQVWVWRVWVVGYKRARFHEALALKNWADQAIARAGGNPLIEAQLANDFGTAAYAFGDYPKASEHLSRSLAIREKVLGPEHVSVASTLTNLGLLAQAQGDHAQAEVHHLRALAIDEKALGSEHPLVASCHNNLGWAAHEQGHYEVAKAHFTRALTIRKQLYGVDHSLVALTLNNLGNVERRQGNRDQALTYYREALKIREAVLEPGHPDIAQSHVSLANLFLEQEEHSKARERLLLALAMLEKRLGPEHADLARVHSNLGEAALALRNFGQARDHFQKAIAIWEKAFGSRHVLLGYPLTGLGWCYLETGRPSEARQVLERALEIRGAQAGDSVDRAHTQFGLARALWWTPKARVRATVLATGALAALAAGGEASKKKLSEVRAWLRSHR